MIIINKQLFYILFREGEKTMDSGDFSIPARRLKTLCTVSGGKLARIANKEERERRVGNLAARIAGNHCIFEDKTVPPGTFSLKTV